MGRLEKLLNKAKELVEGEPEVPGLRIGFASGDYQVAGAYPEEKNGFFNADGERIKESEIRTHPVKGRKSDN